MRKILLTGVAGFVGHKVAQQLIQAGDFVVGIDNINDYYDVKIKEHRLSSLKGSKNFDFKKIDIENKADLDFLFKDHNDFDVVINLAARAGVRYSIENPDIYISTNTQGNLNLLNKCVKHKIKKFILASTSSLYAGKELPFIEDMDVRNPISPYASSKLGAESMCYTYHHLYGIDVSVVRYFTVYGPLSRPDMAQLRFMNSIFEGNEIQLYGDGTQGRDFTHVDDIAKGTILACKEVGFEIINLGGGNNPIEVNEMIARLEDLTGKKAKIKYHEFNGADMKQTWADISKAQKILGWKPEISFDEGLKSCVDHYLENQEFYKHILL